MHRAKINIAESILRRADCHIRYAVAVYIPHAGNRRAKLIAGGGVNAVRIMIKLYRALDVKVGFKGQDVDRAPAPACGHCAHRDFGDSVPVQVPNVGD